MNGKLCLRKNGIGFTAALEAQSVPTAISPGKLFSIGVGKGLSLESVCKKLYYSLIV